MPSLLLFGRTLGIAGALTGTFKCPFSLDGQTDHGSRGEKCEHEEDPREWCDDHNLESTWSRGRHSLASVFGRYFVAHPVEHWRRKTRCQGGDVTWNLN